ncbi:YraN family protein [Panacagrimonas sp.]|uniref:YraN family protein n=1 Tax=Panacagrimonas sp. TaxID=2480088 RepID=UPI003B51BA27
MKGAEAEDLALNYLLSRGLHLVDRNLRAPGGELDLVMRERDVLVIVEVRKRSHAGYGGGAESVDRRKQARIVRATLGLLARRPDWARMAIRFDVVTLDAQDRIEWIPAAFDAQV